MGKNKYFEHMVWNPYTISKCLEKPTQQKTTRSDKQSSQYPIDCVHDENNHTIYGLKLHHIFLMAD